MGIKKISALVPIKSNSERLVNKNFRPFCGKPLYHKVLDKLQQIDSIDKIILNTDSDEIAKSCPDLYSKAIIIKRPSYLTGNEITMNALIAHDIEQVNGEHFIQTHVTNPLLTKTTIERAIDCYFKNLEYNDSLISVTSIKKRVYDEELHPVNHSNDILEMTQNLPEVLIENSNLFLFSRTSFKRNNMSRVGQKPIAFKMREIEGIDIDNLDDFILAELIYENRGKFGLSC